METLESGLPRHRLPPVVLGCGRTSVIDKFSACCHAFFWKLVQLFRCARIASQ